MGGDHGGVRARVCVSRRGPLRAGCCEDRDRWWAIGRRRRRREKTGRWSAWTPTWEAPNSPSSHSQSAPAFPTLHPVQPRRGYIRTGLLVLRYHSLTSLSLQSDLLESTYSAFKFSRQVPIERQFVPRVPSFDSSEETGSVYRGPKENIR